LYPEKKTIEGFMSEVSYIEPLNEVEKQRLKECEDRIARGIAGFKEAGEALLIVREEELYREQYRTWENYCDQRWGFTDGRARQLILGMKTAREIESVTGVTLPTEAATREIRKYAVEDRPKIVAAAAALAVAENREMTTTDIKRAANPPAKPEVDPDKQAVYDRVKYSPIKVWMDTKKITPKQALALNGEIEACKPELRGWLFQMGVCEPSMVAELNDMHRKGSETFEEIRLSCHLEFPDGGQIHISKAKIADLKRLKRLKYEEHLKRLAAERDADKGINPVNLTLYTNDPRRNAEILISLLGERNAREAMRAVNNQLWKSRKKHRSHYQYVR
jgi:hypothetical protein